MGTDAWGIDDGWWDAGGTWHRAPAETVEAFRHAMGGGDWPVTGPPMWFVREGRRDAFGGPCTVELEDGTDLGVRHALPEGLPLGYHRLHPEDGGPATRLVVSPDRCPQPPGGRGWGVTCQLASIRSAHSWGVGDLGDLAGLGRWVAEQGGTVLGVSPIGDPVPTHPRQPSPYSPSSRRFLDPLAIDVGRVARPAGSAPRAGDEVAGRALSAHRTIDRDAAWALKRTALESRWRERPIGHDAAVEAFRAAGGPLLELHAVFCVLAERFGTGWTAWPAEYRDPSSPSVAAVAHGERDLVDFWIWLQWCAETQLAEAGTAIALMGDFPIGVDPSGCDAWTDARVLAQGVRVGAPPDPFSPTGQDWGLPPYDPHRLRAAGYEPFIATMRANLRRYGGLRIDHVMGLFRLFWIPPGGAAADGTYVRFAPGELLDLVALEAARAGAFVVGEDLGTVEPEVRHALAERAVLGTRVAWFEDGPPESWPEPSVATLSTHDLPTVMGALRGTDPRPEHMADRIRDFAGPELGTPAPDAPVPVGDDAPESDVELLVAAHRRLATARSVLALASFEDLVGSPDRVNLPGTIDAYPNWRLAVPTGLDDLDDDPVAGRVVEALREGRQRP